MKYTKEIMERACEGALSLAQVCRNLGLKPVGGNYNTVKSNLDRFGIDVSHFTGQRWNKGLKHIDKTSRYSLKDILKENIDYKSSDLLKRLVSANLKEYKCEMCGYAENLELHHINGNHFDNRLENLQILCPNCHAKTDNFRGKGTHKNSTPENLSKKQAKNHYCTCKNCGKEFYSDRVDKTRKFCSRECYKEYLIKVHRHEAAPLQDYSNISIVLTLENIKKYLDTSNNITELAKIFNTSRTTIRNYLIKYDLYDEFKYKYDFHAKRVGQYDLNGNLIKEWPSITDASTTLNIHTKDISAVCLHKRRSAGGYIWKHL